MLQNDFIYGCRSGIQKGIRRGDLDLVNTCFNALWAFNDQHRDWLKWRVWSITIEETFHLVGELAELLESESDDEKDWKKFIFRLCIATKSKDAAGLWSFMDVGGRWVSHPEYKEMKFVRQVCNSDYSGDYLKIAPALYEGYLQGTEDRQLDDYERGALDLLFRRTQGGGMLNDRYFALTGMVLLFLRGLDSKTVKKDLKFGRERWVKRVNGRTKPRTVNLPWYVFDKHTTVGQKVAGKVLSIWNKQPGKKELNIFQLETIWFYLESAKIGKNRIFIKPKDPKNPAAIDSVFWPELLKLKLNLSSKIKPSDCVKMWRDGGLRELCKQKTIEMLDNRNGKR